MKDFLKKTWVFAILVSVILIVSDAYVLLDTFVIPHNLETAGRESALAEETEKQGQDEQQDNQGQGTQEEADQEQDVQGQGAQNQDDQSKDTQNRDTGEAVITADSYSDGNMQISVNTVREYDTTIYIADVQLNSALYLKTALADDTFGTNITQKTSGMAEENGAILAVNGDYYGANKRGYVIKNGVLYRESVRGDSSYGDMVLYEDGTAGVISEEEVSARELIAGGVSQLFAFGPILLEDGEVKVSEDNEVGKAMASNPRTAIGCIGPLHYVLLVSDGRTQESEGLSLYELAQVMQEYGCTFAYNLDGGGSSTMYFNGRIVNNPTTSGRKISERAVSDIVYIGY